MQGWANFHKGAYDQAISAFNQSLVADPNAVQGYWGLGDTYRELGDFERAVDYYHQYIDMAGDNARPEVVAYVAGYEGETLLSSSGRSNTSVLLLALLSIIGVILRWRYVSHLWTRNQERSRKPKSQRVEDQIRAAKKMKS